MVLQEEVSKQIVLFKVYDTFSRLFKHIYCVLLEHSFENLKFTHRFQWLELNNHKRLFSSQA